MAEPPPTSAVLMALAKHIAVRCQKPNAAFTDCKRRDKDPESCLGEGKAVTGCVVDLIREANRTAPVELKQYYECLDYYSNKFEKCRKEQAAFEKAFQLT